MHYPSERAPILDGWEDRYDHLQDKLLEPERPAPSPSRIESAFSRMKHRTKPARRTGRGPRPLRKRSTAHLYEILPRDGVAIREGVAIDSGLGHGAEHSLDQVMDVLHSMGEVAILAAETQS